jgi:hypothetical protein
MAESPVPSRFKVNRMSVSVVFRSMVAFLSIGLVKYSSPPPPRMKVWSERLGF